MERRECLFNIVPGGLLLVRQIVGSFPPAASLAQELHQGRPPHVQARKLWPDPPRLGAGCA